MTRRCGRPAVAGATSQQRRTAGSAAAAARDDAEAAGGGAAVEKTTSSGSGSGSKPATQRISSDAAPASGTRTSSCSRTMAAAA
ncbi:hypothetical protein Scep_002572 [Stephania cephalantha]|uniref:Uncharacterized protein n=1 Tax=Stephania cephalantha TaxID=152367 RepID=A0AAP0Q8X0_9MAGN